MDIIYDTSPRWLEHAEIAEIVCDALKFLDSKFCHLITYTIMPTHVHTVFIPMEKEEGNYYAISKIMHSWKRVSAIRANEKLHRTGTFWHHENYNHYARDAGEVERIVSYVKNNPVKAGLVSNWDDWLWTFTAG